MGATLRGHPRDLVGLGRKLTRYNVNAEFAGDQDTLELQPVLGAVFERHGTWPVDVGGALRPFESRAWAA